MKDKAYQSIAKSIRYSLDAYSHRQVLEARRNCFIALGKFSTYSNDLDVDLGSDFESIIEEVAERYIKQLPEYCKAKTEEEKDRVFIRYLNTFYQCYINDVYYQNYCENL